MEPPHDESVVQFADIPFDVAQLILGHPTLSSRDVAATARANLTLAALVVPSTFKHVTLSDASIAKFGWYPALRGGACESLTLASESALIEAIDFARVCPELTRRITRITLNIACAKAATDFESVLDGVAFPSLQTFRFNSQLRPHHAHLLADSRVSCNDVMLYYSDLRFVTARVGGLKVNTLHLKLFFNGLLQHVATSDATTSMCAAADNGFAANDVIITLDHQSDYMDPSFTRAMAVQVARLTTRSLSITHLDNSQPHPEDLVFVHEAIDPWRVTMVALSLHYTHGLFDLLVDQLLWEPCLKTRSRPLKQCTLSFAPGDTLNISEAGALTTFLQHGVDEFNLRLSSNVPSGYPLGLGLNPPNNGLASALAKAFANASIGTPKLSFSAPAAFLIHVLPGVACKDLSLRIEISGASASEIIVEQARALGVIVSKLLISTLEVEVVTSMLMKWRSTRAFVDSLLRGLAKREFRSIRSIRTPSMQLLRAVDGTNSDTLNVHATLQAMHHDGLSLLYPARH